MLIESVLALEVGAAASRIFSSAIWEDRSAQVQASARRGGPSAGAQGQGTQEGLEALAGRLEPEEGLTMYWGRLGSRPW